MGVIFVESLKETRGVYFHQQIDHLGEIGADGFGDRVIFQTSENSFTDMKLSSNRAFHSFNMGSSSPPQAGCLKSGTTGHNFECLFFVDTVFRGGLQFIDKEPFRKILPFPVVRNVISASAFLGTEIPSERGGTSCVPIPIPIPCRSRWVRVVPCVRRGFSAGCKARIFHRGFLRIHKMSNTSLA